MTFRSGSLLLSLPLLACAAPDTTIDHVHDACAPLVIVAAEDSTAQERSSIEAAIAMWNAAARTQLLLDGDPAADRLVVTFREAAPAFFGLYDDEAREVIVNRKIGDPHARAVTITHELGHAMGLEHVDRDARVSLMNPANLDLGPTAEDLTALEALWGRCTAGAR